MHARGLERLLRRALAYRNRLDVLERLAHRRLDRRIVQRSGANGVQHDRDALLPGDLHFAQVYARLGVVKDTAAAKEQNVQALDLGHDLGARQVAHRHGALDAVAALRVLGISRKHRDFDAQVAAQLRNDGLQDGLVAEVQAAVRAGNADAIQVFAGHAPNAAKNRPYGPFGLRRLRNYEAAETLPGRGLRVMTS